MSDVRPRRIQTPKSAFAQSVGFTVSTILLAFLAGTLGAMNHAAWVIAPGVLAIGGSVATLVLIRGHYPASNADPEPFMRWYTSRGLPMILLSAVPAYVAIAGMSIALRHH